MDFTQIEFLISEFRFLKSGLTGLITKNQSGNIPTDKPENILGKNLG
jgi:hypothetical protein